MSKKYNNQHYNMAALVGYLWSNNNNNNNNRENKVNFINIYESMKSIFIEKENIFNLQKEEIIEKLNCIFNKKIHERSVETAFHNKIITTETEEVLKVQEIENEIFNLSCNKNIKNGKCLDFNLESEEEIILKKFLALQISRNPVCYSNYIDNWFLEKLNYYEKNKETMKDTSLFNLLSIAHFENAVSYLNTQVVKKFNEMLNHLNNYQIDIVELDNPGFLTDCTVFLNMKDELENTEKKTYFLPVNNKYTLVFFHTCNLKQLENIKIEYNLIFYKNALSTSRNLAYFQEKDEIVNNLSNYILEMHSRNGLETFFRRYFEINTKITNIERMFKDYIDLKEANLLFNYERTSSIIY